MTQTPEALVLIENAAAFAHSARRLVESFAQDEYDRAPAYHNVLLYLTYAAIELCCKAWLTSQNTPYKKNHDIAALYKQFMKASPPAGLEMPEDFGIEERFDEVRTLDLFREFPAIDLRTQSKIQQTQYKYASDHNGQRFIEVDLVPLRDRQAQIESVTNSITRVQLEIHRRWLQQ